MKILSRENIRKWYQSEYSCASLDSVYQPSPEPLQRFYQLLEENKETVKTILDLGCGDGRSLIELAKRGFEVTGIDFAGKEAVETRAEHVGVQVRFFKEDLTAFHFEHSKYNAIISSEVFHLMSRDEVDQVLDRIKEAAHKNGFVYISILSGLKRYFLKTGEEFSFENQANYSVQESKLLLNGKFTWWNFILLDTFHGERDWPLKEGDYPLEPYHWSGEYVYLIAQKR